MTGKHKLFLAPPKNRHFVPRYSKLRKAGGKSISFYEKWRKMQYDMNCVMKRYMELISVNLSGKWDHRTSFAPVPFPDGPGWTTHRTSPLIPNYIDDHMSLSTDNIMKSIQ